MRLFRLLKIVSVSVRFGLYEFALEHERARGLRTLLERLLLRLGPDGRVTKTADPALADAGSQAACRLMGRRKCPPASRLLAPLR